MDKENKNNTTESGFNLLLKDKKQFVIFLLFAIATLVSIVFLFKMSLSGITLIYTILLCLGGAGLTYYTYSISKKNTNLLFWTLLILIVCFVLRVIQCSISQNIEYTVRYLLFFAGLALIFYNLYKKDSKNNKTLITILLLAGALDAIYLFFSLGNVSFLGYIWRLFLIAECLLSIGLAFSNFDFNALKELNSSCKSIVEKLPKVIIVIVVVIVLAVGLYLINLSSDGNDTSYDPINGNGSGSGTVIDSKDEENEEEVDTTEKVSVYKGKNTYVKTEYGNDEYEVEVSVSDIYISDKITPPSPQQSYYTYYEAKDGKTYLALVLEVKNVGAQTINTDYLFTNFLGDHCSPKAVFDSKYEYGSGTVIGLDKDNSGEYDLDSYYYLDALETVKLYTIFEVSDEVSDKPAVINSCFGDVTLNIINESETY